VGGLPALVLLLAPILVREPIGGADWERIEDPLARRVASLLAGEPVVSGVVTVVPLYARVPSEAGHGHPATIFAGGDGLTALVVMEGGRPYLRVTNPAGHAVLVSAGTLFAGGGCEFAVERDAVVPAEFAALIPARPCAGAAVAVDLELDRAGLLAPGGVGALLLGQEAFASASNRWRSLRGEQGCVPVLRNAAVLGRGASLRARVAPLRDALGGTAVGAVFLVGERPVAAHVFATHDLFMEALPDLLRGVAVTARDEELAADGPFALRRQAVMGDAEGRAVAWLRNVGCAPDAWSESYGAGFEAILVSEADLTVGHAVVDQRRTLIHAGFYVPDAWPQQAAGAPPPNDGRWRPPPPVDPTELPPGFRERRPRPTEEDKRRDELNPNPGPSGPGAEPGSRTPPDRAPPAGGGGGGGSQMPGPR